MSPQKHMRAASFMVFALLTGCAADWRHASKGAGDFERDLYECEKDAAPQRDSVLARQMKVRCLQLKGWRQS